MILPIITEHSVPPLCSQAPAFHLEYHIIELILLPAASFSRLCPVRILIGEIVGDNSLRAMLQEFGERLLHTAPFNLLLE